MYDDTEDNDILPYESYEKYYKLIGKMRQKSKFLKENFGDNDDDDSDNEDNDDDNANDDMNRQKFSEISNSGHSQEDDDENANQKTQSKDDQNVRDTIEDAIVEAKKINYYYNALGVFRAFVRQQKNLYIEMNRNETKIDRWTLEQEFNRFDSIFSDYSFRLLNMGNDYQPETQRERDCRETLQKVIIDCHGLNTYYRSFVKSHRCDYVFVSIANKIISKYCDAIERYYAPAYAESHDIEDDTKIGENFDNRFKKSDESPEASRSKRSKHRHSYPNILPDSLDADDEIDPIELLNDDDRNELIFDLREKNKEYKMTIEKLNHNEKIIMEKETDLINKFKEYQNKMEKKNYELNKELNNLKREMSKLRGGKSKENDEIPPLEKEIEIPLYVQSPPVAPPPVAPSSSGMELDVNDDNLIIPGDFHMKTLISPQIDSDPEF